MANRRELNELNKLLAELEKKYKSLNRISPFNGKDAREVAKNYDSVADAIKEVETSMKGIRADILEMDSGLEGVKESFRDISRELGGTDRPLKNMTKSFNKIRNLAEDLSDIQYNIADASRKEIRSLKSKVNLEFQRLATQAKFLKSQIESGKLQGKELSDAKELLALAEDSARNLEDKVGHQKDFNKAINKTLKNQRNINKAIGLSGKAVSGLAGFAEKIGFGDMSEDVAAVGDEMKAHAIQLTDNGNKAATLGDQFRIMGTGMKGLGKALASALTDPLVIITMIVKFAKLLLDIFGQMQKKVRDVGQLFGASGAQAKQLKNEIHAAGDASGDIYYFTEELIKAQGDLNKAVGMNLKFSEKNTKAYLDMTMYMGMSEEAAQGLAKISAEQGVAFDEQLQLVMDTTDSLFKQTGFSLKSADAVEAMSQASASVRYNVKGGVEGLVKAAHTAARLGLTMNEIAAAAESHLDFESSIQKEIEAEMFLQKDLNLEKLRYAAMTGNVNMQQAEINRLIQENKADLGDNVFKQQKFADALGISHEQLMESLNTDKKISVNKKDQLNLNKEDAKAQADLGKKAVEMDRLLQSAVKQLKAALEPLAQVVAPLIIGFLTKMVSMIKPIADFLSTGVGKAVLAIAGVALGFQVLKGVANKITGGLFDRGATAINPLYTYNVNEQGGGGGFMPMMLGRRGMRSGKMFKNMSKYVGGKNTFMGKQLRNLSAMSFKRSSYLNQIVKHNKTLSKIFPSMAVLNSKVRGGTGPGSKYAQAMDAKAANARATSSKAPKTNVNTKTTKTGSVADDILNNKATQKVTTKSTSKIASKLGIGSLTKVPLLGPLLDIGMSGYFGSDAASMSAEEQKAAGIKEDIGGGEAFAYELLTGNSSKGSMFTEMLGGEKGSVGDEALGFGTAAASGALTGSGIGAAIGAFFGGVGAAPGAAIGGAVGAVVGTVTEAFKVFSDPNSAMRQSLSAGMDWVGGKLSEAGSAIKEWGTEAWSSVSSFASSSMETLSEWGSDAWNSIGSFASDSMESLTSWATDSWNSVSTFAQDSYNTVTSLASSAADMAGDAYNYASSLANDIGSSISSTASDAWEGAKDVGSSVVNTVGGWLGFNEGGIVPGGPPYTDRVPAMLTPGERVIPAGGNDEMTALLRELISVVKQGGDVYLDGNKVGHALALQSSRMG